MKKYKIFALIALPLLIFSIMGMKANDNSGKYFNLYQIQLDDFDTEQQSLVSYIQSLSFVAAPEIETIKQRISSARLKMKALDFWLRYLEPVAYMKINGPLPVEWETEVFEKNEKPYKRNGAGLSLAELYLDEPVINKDSLVSLIRQSRQALNVFRADSITGFFQRPDHFFFANRLFLLNLAAIYTTGFECPDSSRVIPELAYMLKAVSGIYTAFGNSFPVDSLSQNYLSLYAGMQQFVNTQGTTPSNFDHYRFIKNYVNPLFSLNQQFIHRYHAISKNYNDYALNNNCQSIFDKSLYRGQNEKGIYIAVDDTTALNDIRETGRLLFYDPILSGNGKRSCASCHKPTEYFTDTAFATSLEFGEAERLPRNTPTLINAVYNHLLMLDGKHYTLQNQGKDVIMNSVEMGSAENDIISNVISCNMYKKAFQRYVKLTPNYPQLSIEHIVSAITLYYSDFSKFNSPFDRSINDKEDINEESVKGFNIFMSKAQCATCHFVPQFNGVKPPYISSEFEVLGVPEDTAYHSVSKDSGRYVVNPANELLHAFRTGTIRNSSFTKPYMHNGVFKSLDEVIDFYDAGGGNGHGFAVENQTLSSDSLHLSVSEKKALKIFMKSLDENIIFDSPPTTLPETKLEKYKNRAAGGIY